MNFVRTLPCSEKQIHSVSELQYFLAERQLSRLQRSSLCSFFYHTKYLPFCNSTLLQSVTFFCIPQNLQSNELNRYVWQTIFVCPEISFLKSHNLSFCYHGALDGIERDYYRGLILQIVRDFECTGQVQFSRCLFC